MVVKIYYLIFILYVMHEIKFTVRVFVSNCVLKFAGLYLVISKSDLCSFIKLNGLRLKCMKVSATSKYYQILIK